MPAQITTSSSIIKNTNTNSSIPESSFTTPVEKNTIKNITLSEIQSAVEKLSTYVEKVSNCNTIYSYVVHSTSCQSTTCQSTTCQSQSCQSQSCQSLTCQSGYCQYCQCQSGRYDCSDGS